MLARVLDDPEPLVRARAARALGRVQLRSHLAVNRSTSTGQKRRERRERERRDPAELVRDERGHGAADHERRRGHQ